MIMECRSNDSLIDLLRRLVFCMVVCMLMHPVLIVASAI